MAVALFWVGKGLAQTIAKMAFFCPEYCCPNSDNSKTL
jgi:hypothetical protein